MANSEGNLNWLALYKEAVLEPDRRQLRTRVQMDAAAHFLGILRLIGDEKW